MLGAVQVLRNHFEGGGGYPKYYNWLQFIEGDGSGEVLLYYSWIGSGLVIYGGILCKIIVILVQNVNHKIVFTVVL